MNDRKEKLADEIKLKRQQMEMLLDSAKIQGDLDMIIEAGHLAASLKNLERIAAKKSTAAHCTRLKIKRPLWSVWKDEECERKYQWKLQAPKGIDSFPTKKSAQQMADGMKELENK